jgi:NitT/TauT family transport system substrate-binding protein
MNRAFSIFLAALTVLSGCRKGEKAPAIDSTAATPRMSASLRLGWIPSGSFAGEVTGQALFAKNYGLDLKIEPGGPSMNTVALVQSGQNTFGTIAADEVLAANEKGADLVIIGVINYFSPGGFISLAKSGIKTPKQFEGKKVGMLPFGSTTMLYESLLAKNKVNRRRVREMVVSPDLRSFLQGAYDVHPVFVYDETVTLDQQQIAYNLIEPKSFGVSFRGPVYFTTRETIATQPKVVEAFVDAMADGWNYALAHQPEAIRYLKAFAVEIDTVRESSVLKKGADYFSGYQHQPLNSDTASWRPMVAEMVRLRKLEKEPSLDRVLDFGAIGRYYSRKASSIP